MKYSRLTIATFVGLGLVLAALWLLGGPYRSTRAADLCVDSFASIQEAIGSASDGDTVRVPTGRYTETLVITRTVLLQGGWNGGCSSRVSTDPGETVIDGGAAGSVIYVALGSPTLEGLTLTGGWNNEGGGLYVDWTSAALDNVVVIGNVVSTTIGEPTRGAGIYVSRNAGINLSYAEIVSNTAYAYPGQTSMGGGIFLDGPSTTANLTATRILSNVNNPGTDLRGGGVYMEDATGMMFHGTENLIAHNRAWYGGGIRMHAAQGITGAVVMSNAVTVYGGGVFVQGSSGIIANSIIASNSSAVRGSGIYFYNADMDVVNNTLVGNLGGGGIAIDMDGIVVPTLTNNIVANHKIGVYNRSATVSPTLITNDVWNNNVANYQGVLTGATDLHVDPLFIDPGGGDYHLAAGSPLINAGSAVPWLLVDFDGELRALGPVDVGAYEYVLPAFLPLVLRDN